MSRLALSRLILRIQILSVENEKNQYFFIFPYSGGNVDQTIAALAEQRQKQSKKSNA